MNRYWIKEISKNIKFNQSPLDRIFYKVKRIFPLSFFRKNSILKFFEQEFFEDFQGSKPL